MQIKVLQFLAQRNAEVQTTYTQAGKITATNTHYLALSSH